MAKGRRDVDLVIRARNEASKAIDAVQSALGELLKAQDSVGKSASKNGSLLEQLGTELGNLRKQVQGASAMERLATGMDTAREAVERLEKSVAGARNEQSRLAGEVTKAEGAVAGLEKQSAKAAATLERQKTRALEARDAQKQFNQELGAAQRAQASAAKAYEKAGHAFEIQRAKLDAIAKAQNAAADAVNKTKEPTRQQVALYERLSKAFDKQKEKVDAAGKKYIDLAGDSDKADAALARLQKRSEAVAARFEKAQSAQAESANSLKVIQQQAGEAAANLSRLRSSAAQSDAALEKQNAALAEARTEMEGVAAAASQADAALDKIAATARQRLLRSLADAQNELARLQAQQSAAQSAVRASVAGGGSVSNPSPELATSLSSARAAKTAYTELQAAIQQMRAAVREAGTDVNKLTAAQEAFVAVEQRVQGAVRAAADADRAAAGAVKTLEQNTRQAGSASEAAAVKTRAFASTIELLRGNGRKSLSLFQRLRGEVLSLTASYLGFFAAIQQFSNVTDSFRTMEAAQSRLGIVFDQNSKKVADELGFVQRLSDRLSLNFKVLAEEYSKFAVSTKGTPLEGDQTRKIFEAVAVAARSANLSMEQVQGTFLALSQMVSKGVVSMEELRRQMGDRLYGAFQIAAKAMGLTTEQLNKLVSTGQLASTSLLPKFAAELEKTFGPQLGDSLKGLNAQIAAFQNELFKGELAIARGGFIDGLRDALKSLTEFFKDDAGKKFFAELGQAAGTVIKLLAVIPKHLHEIVTFLSVMVGIKASVFLRTFAADFAKAIVQAKQMPAAIAASNRALAANRAGVTGLAASLTTLRAGYTATVASARTSAAAIATSVRSFNAARVASSLLTGALGLLRGALAALGGIPGLIITGITIALGQWLTKTDETTSATDQLAQSVDRVRNAIEDADKSTKDWLESLKKANVGELLRGIDKAQGEIAKSRKQAEENPADLSYLQKFGLFQYAKNNPKADLASLMDIGPAGRALNEATNAFRKGAINGREFREELSRIYAKFPEMDSRLKDVWDGLDKIAASSENSEKQVERARAELAYLNGTATDAQKAMLGLDKAQEKVAGSTADLSGAIAKLKEKIPSLKLVAERAKALKELDDLKLTVDLTDVDKASAAYKEFLALLQKARDEVNRKFDDERLGNLADRIIAAESGGRSDAANSKSSAVGVGQFIESTWIRLFKQYFPDRAEGMTREAILDLRKNAEISKQLIEAYAKENSDILKKAGVSVNDAAVYLAHFLGPGGALKVLKASPDTPVASLLGEKAVKANPSVLGGDKTAGQLVEWAQRRVDLTDRQVQLEGQVNRALSAQAATAAEFHTNLQSQLDIEQQRVAPAKQRTMEEEVTAALLKAQNDARKAGTQLSEEEVQRVTQITEETYRLKHAQDEANEAKRVQREMDRDLNKAIEVRAALYKQIQAAESRGDTTKVDELTVRYNDVSKALDEMIQKQLAYWQTVGGPEADIAIAKLESIPETLDRSGKEFLLTKEEMQKGFAEGLGGSAVDSFLSKMREGQSLFVSMRDSFREFLADFLLGIAKAILKQQIYNAVLIITKILGGTTTNSGALAGPYHTGGIAGSPTTTRQISAGWFANAARYHSGGIAGLKPGEVPAILQKGEEVLTRDDPRHIANGGAAPGASATNVKIINTIDSGSVVSEGLNTRSGEKAIFNFIRANQSSVKRELGLV